MIAELENDDENALSLLEYMPSGVLLEIFKFLDWNDICQVASTCTKFRDVCSSATLWLQLDTLDFRKCVIPDPEKILGILHRTSNAAHIILGDIISDETDATQAGDSGEEDVSNDNEPMEDNDGEEYARDNLTSSDRFVLNVLKSCPRVRTLELHMHKITNTSVDAICAKCTALRRIELHDNPHIQSATVCGLVSFNNGIKELVIDSCEELGFLEIRHTVPGQHLNLTHVSFLGQRMLNRAVQVLMESCPYLIELDLTASQYLDRFFIDIVQVGKTGLDSLQILRLKMCEDLVLVSLPYCPNLLKLDTSHCLQLQEISATSPKLHTFDTVGCAQVNKIDLTSSDIEQLCCRGMEQLETLNIGSDHMTRLDLSDCSRLSTQNLSDAITNKAALTFLNLCGCKNISPTDVNSQIFPQFTGLKTLKYGGHSWNSVPISSENITHLEFSNCINTTCILLNSPSLTDLTLNECRDFSEQELMDSFLHGKLVTRMQGLESLMTDQKQQAFTEHSGIPNLSSLKCHNLPGLHGDILSHDLSYFTNLSTLEFVHCTFLEHVKVSKWNSLSSLKIESCNRLNTVLIDNVPSLQNLDVRWCSMVHDFQLDAINLISLDVTGTNFAELCIHCDKLSSLSLNGVCTQPRHTINLRCSALQELSLVKCDRLTDFTLSDIVKQNPQLLTLTLVGSLSLRCISVPSCVEVLSLTGHRTLRDIDFGTPISIHHLTLNNLPKLVPSEREMLLKQCEETLRILEVRAIPGEKMLCLQLQNLRSLTLDQGIHLASLDIQCPKLKFLRIQGCPKLHSLTLHVDSLTQVQVYHSTPLLALRRLSLHSRQVVHLARVLAYYCPKLEELFLHESEVRGSQLYRLGQSLHSLKSVTLNKCVVMDFDKTGHSQIIESSAIDRNNGENLLLNFIESS